jgi:hypothetical protein
MVRDQIEFYYLDDLIGNENLARVVDALLILGKGKADAIPT